MNRPLWKFDESLGLIFGFAIISKINGERYFDRQGDHIGEEAMMEAALDYMTSERVLKEMHAGEAKGQTVFAFPLTDDTCAALGISCEKRGLLIGVKPDPTTLQKFRDGTFSGFSIGGYRIEDEEFVE